MKKFIYSLLIIVPLSCMIHTCANSQAVTRPPDRMKMLTAFNGEWKGEMVTIVEKKKIKYKLSHTSLKVAGGWGVQLNEVAMIPGKGKYQAVRVFSYGNASDTTFMYTVDSDGETWFYKGVWESNKKLLLKTSDMKDGKKVDKIISYTFLSPKEYDLKSITQIEGKEDDIVEVKMARQ